MNVCTLLNHCLLLDYINTFIYHTVVYKTYPCMNKAIFSTSRLLGRDILCDKSDYCTESTNTIVFVKTVCSLKRLAS